MSTDRIIVNRYTHRRAASLPRKLNHLRRIITKKNTLGTSTTASSAQVRPGDRTPYNNSNSSSKLMELDEVKESKDSRSIFKNSFWKAQKKPKIKHIPNKSQTDDRKLNPLLPRISSIYRKDKQNKKEKFWQFQKNKEEKNIVEKIYLTSTGFKQKLDDFLNSEYSKHRLEHYEKIRKSQSYANLLEKSEFLTKKKIEKSLYFLDKEKLENDLKMKQHYYLSRNLKFKKANRKMIKSISESKFKNKVGKTFHGKLKSELDSIVDNLKRFNSFHSKSHLDEMKKKLKLKQKFNSYVNPKDPDNPTGRRTKISFNQFYNQTKGKNPSFNFQTMKKNILTMGEVAMHSKAKRDTDEDDYFVSRASNKGLRYYVIPWKDVKDTATVSCKKMRLKKGMSFMELDQTTENYLSEEFKNSIHDYDRLIREEVDEEKIEKLKKDKKRYENVKRERARMRSKRKVKNAFFKILKDL